MPTAYLGYSIGPDLNVLCLEAFFRQDLLVAVLGDFSPD